MRAPGQVAAANSAGQSQPVSPSHLRFARSVRLARALRGIRVMRLLRCLGETTEGWGLGWNMLGKHMGLWCFRKFKHRHLVEELEFNLSSTLRLGFGSAISAVKGIYGEKTSIFWVIYYSISGLGLNNQLWVDALGSWKITELNGGLNPKIYNFQQGILD